MDEYPDGIAIALEGPVTLYEVAGIRDILREALADGKAVRVDLKGTGRWDIAGLQLLISFVRTGEARGQRVELLEIPAACREIAERSGFAKWLDDVKG